MKNSQQWKWFIDVGLFIGLIVATWLDLTGLPIHQWLGLGVGLLAGYHLLAHWGWVRSITRRWFDGASRNARTYYLVDGALMTGFAFIVITGLFMSTWFDLPLASYESWREIHVYVTIATLVLTVIKVGLHWRWVVNVGRRIFAGAGRPAAESPAPAVLPRSPALVQAPVNTGRRDFLRLMGVVGAASVVAAYAALDGNALSDGQALAQASVDSTGSLPEPQVRTVSSTSTSPAKAEPTATTAATATPTQASSSATATSEVEPTAITVDLSSCSVRCNRRCSYPGHCRRYQDSNGNGRCDLGECA